MANTDVTTNDTNNATIKVAGENPVSAPEKKPDINNNVPATNKPEDKAVNPRKKGETQQVTLSVLSAMGYAFKSPIKAAAFTGMLIGAAADGLFDALPNVDYTVRNGTKLLAAGMAAAVQTAGKNLIGKDFDNMNADDLRNAIAASWEESDQK